MRKTNTHPTATPTWMPLMRCWAAIPTAGDYVIEIARDLYCSDGDVTWVDADPEKRALEFRERSYKAMLDSH